MDTPTRDGAAVRLPPPLVFLLALLLGFALQFLVTPLRPPLPGGLRVALAVALALAGLALAGAAIGLFRRSGQDPRPWESTPEVIAHGVYRYTRNPMYVGMALVQAAIGVGAANGWILALVPVSLAIVFVTAVRHEEAYLTRKFGAEYVAYTQRVRRWL